jgi:hypothetical protein
VSLSAPALRGEDVVRLPEWAVRGERSTVVFSYGSDNIPDAFNKDFIRAGHL